MRLGPILRAYRLHTELTVRELAKRMGLSAATLSRIEGGDTMDGTTLASILKYMMEKEK